MLQDDDSDKEEEGQADDGQHITAFSLFELLSFDYYYPPFQCFILLLIVGVGYKNEVFRNPRCNSLNERGLFPEQFGTNFIAIGQKLSLRQPKTCREGGFLAAAGNRA